MSSVAIFQTYIPAYREPFFRGLIDHLADEGVRCDVFAGAPHGEQARRGDQVVPVWCRHHQPRYLWAGVKRVPYYGAARVAQGHDAVILTLEGTSPDIYELILGRRKPRLGLWGHVGSYVKPANRLDRALEAWAMRHSAHVFAYTPRGAAVAAESGVEQARITAVMNTIDTTELAAAIARVDESQRSRFMHRYHLLPGKTIAYIGGLDASKRIDFLAEALELLWTQDPDIRILVAGDGSGARLLDAAVQRGQAVRLGYCGPEAKALIASTASLIAMPGRIGLVAVEALVMDLPVVTTTWPYHAPEVEYLEEGDSLFSSGERTGDFVGLIIALLSRLDDQRDRRAMHLAATAPDMQQMVSNFARGVRAMLGPTRP